MSAGKELDGLRSAMRFVVSVLVDAMHNAGVIPAPQIARSLAQAIDALEQEPRPDSHLIGELGLFLIAIEGLAAQLEPTESGTRPRPPLSLVPAPEPPAHESSATPPRSPGPEGADDPEGA